MKGKIVSIKRFCKRGLVAMLACALVATSVPAMAVNAETTEETTVPPALVAITEGMTVTASGTSEGSTDNIFDGNATTYWTSQEATDTIADDSTWLKVDMGAVYKIGKVEFTARWDNSAKWNCTGNIKKLVVEVSTDGENWNDVTPDGGEDLTSKITADDNSSYFPHAVRFDGVEAQYIRITGLESYHWNSEKVNKYITVADLTIYEADETVAIAPAGIGVEPIKTTYYQDDTISNSDVVVTLKYNNDTTETLAADAYIVTADTSVAGERNVTVTYDEFIADYTIDVIGTGSAADDRKDYDVAKLTYTAGSQYTSNSGSTGDGKIAWAFDNNHETWWHSAYDPEWSDEAGTTRENYLWVEMKFEEPTVVDAVRYLPRGGNGDITNYKILGTVDGETWIELTAGTWGRSGWNIAEFTARKLSAVKLVSTAGDSWASAKEIRVREGELVDITTGMIAYYNFENVEENAETVSNVVDETTYPATILGGTFSNEADSWGTSMSLPGGDNNGLSIPSIMNTGAKSYSISMWYKQDSASKAILAQQDGARRTLLLINSDGAYSTNVNGSEKYGTTVVDTAEWQHITWVYNYDADTNTSNVSFYVNGELDAAGAIDTGNESGMDVLTNLLIGRHKNPGGTSFVGLVDEIRVYEGAVTAEQAKAIYEEVHVTGVTLNQTEVTISEVGEAVKLKATVAPENATNQYVTWTSSNTDVATVANGVVTAIANGVTTITATTEDGNFTTTCTVKVVDIEETIILGVGENYTKELVENGTVTVEDETIVTAEVKVTGTDVKVPLHDHQSNQQSSLTGYSADANENISLEKATFEFVATETENQWTIYNESTNQYLTYSSAANMFTDTTGIMNIYSVDGEDGVWNISSSSYLIFWYANMDINGWKTIDRTAENRSYDFVLLEKKDSISDADIIPGYAKVTTIEDGGKYVIAHIWNDKNVFVLYPANGGTAAHTKLVGETIFTDKYSLELDALAVGTTNVWVGNKIYEVVVKAPEVTTGANWVNYKLPKSAIVDGLSVTFDAAENVFSSYEVYVTADADATWTDNPDAYTIVCEGTWNDEVGTKTTKFKPVEAVQICLVSKDTEVSTVTIGESEISYANELTDDFFIGGALRMDYVGYDKTSIRFMYVFPTEFNGMTVDTDTTDGDGGSWRWSYGKTKSMTTVKDVADGKWLEKDGMINSNIVFTNVTRDNYDTTLYTQLAVTYSDTEGNTLTVYDSVIGERSVNTVANAIKEAYAGDETKADQYNYALGILGELTE